MTLIGPDVASFQAGLDLAELTDASYFLVKSTQGDNYVDPYYAAWAKQVAGVGKPLIWYHFLTTDAAPGDQAAFIKRVVDASLPGMLDVEPTTASAPSYAFLLSMIDACTAVGLRIKLVYLPKWYWQQLGSPDLSGLSQRGVVVVSSDYPGSGGTGPAQYNADGGDEGAGWAAYGGITPSFWQYTDSASEGGQQVDYSAYRGTASQLAALLDEAVPTGVTSGAPASSAYPQIQLGSTGDAVSTLQLALNKLGYGLTVDASFGPDTQGAVKAYQYAHGLTVDGIVGPATWGSINASRTGTAFPGTVEIGSSGPRVRQVQQQLYYRGYALTIDGVFGPQTQGQVEAFQKNHALQVDGIVGVHTWTSLFD